MNNNNLPKSETIKDTKNIDSKEIDNTAYKQVYSRLLNNYQIITKLEKIYTPNNITLEDLEDYCYTIQGNKLTSKERVELEINRIKRYLPYTKYKEYIFPKLKTIENYLKLDTKEYQKIEFYIKKEIVKLQTLLNIETTFFNASIKAYQEETRNINLQKYSKEKSVK